MSRAKRLRVEKLKTHNPRLCLGGSVAPAGHLGLLHTRQWSLTLGNYAELWVSQVANDLVWSGDTWSRLLSSSYLSQFVVTCNTVTQGAASDSASVCHRMQSWAVCCTIHCINANLIYLSSWAPLSELWM